MTESRSPSRAQFVLVQGVTLLRFPLALVFAGMLCWTETSPAVRFTGTLLLALIELSDMLDGLLARRLNAVSEWGAILDPYADSVSRITVYWGIAAAGLTFSILPLTMALRDITVAYCRIMWTRRGQSASARWSGKLKAVVQGAGAFFLFLGPHVFPPNQWVTPTVSWIVLVVTLGSLLEYVGQTIQLMKRG